MQSLPEPVLHAIESGRIPSPPQLLLRLLHLVDDEQASIGALATLVKQDAGLVSRLLSVANSPALRRGAPLHSLEGCLTSLGTRLVRSIATCLSIQNLFDQGCNIPPADLARFWAHSLTVAELSRRVALAAGYPHPDEAYLAGLLHDIGQLILISALGNPYLELLAESGDDDALQAKELARFGTHHGEIGTWLTDRWQFDSSFADGILFHHAKPGEIATAAILPQAVWLAHALAAKNESDPEMSALFGELTGTEGDLIRIRQETLEQTLRIAQALGLSIPETDCTLRLWRDIQITQAIPEKDCATDELSAAIGGMALLQPLQQDLFALESDAEVLLSLKESARILFDLNRIAFLFLDPERQVLSGNGIGDQPAIFRQVDVPLDASRSLLATAALGRQIRSSFDDLARPDSLIDIQFARAFGSPGLLCLPMLSRQRLTGIMVCGFSQAQHNRLSRRLPWLLNFGRIAAIALESLREARAFREQAEQEAAGHFTRQARRIIHEAGNPLGIIKSYLKILDRKLPEEVGVRQELEVLREEIDRVAGIVGRMSELPAQTTHGKQLDAGQLVDELLLLYGDALFPGRGIRVEIAKPEGSLPINCDRDSLKQILLNLWKNASEALESGQQLRISLTDGVVHDGRSYIQLRMDDNGPGMSETAMLSIHRPVETAGSTTRGMGLAIVGTLAARQGIPITCRSQPGKGTSIALLIPRSESTKMPPEAREESDTHPGQACGASDQ
ncbi:MAG: HDOD domain-containing protein [Dechloromonas sp.]|nr:MAG: HDOD domain-containing protein [Dechloromonas sp.]